ncbi:hypothetical protein ACK39C_20400, partial [Aeromonas veronii]
QKRVIDQNGRSPSSTENSKIRCGMTDIIKINEELVVFHAQQGKKYSDADRVATIDYHSKPLSLPKYNRLAPSVELVHKRYSKD